MRQKLFTKDIDKQLFKQYPFGNQLGKQKVICKIFNPYGRGLWYVLNSDSEDPDYLWCIVQLYEIEVGSVSRKELESIRIRGFLPLERDISFDPMNAVEVLKKLTEGGRP